MKVKRGGGTANGNGMGRRFIVQLDLEQIRTHLSREDGHTWTAAEVLDWLRQTGFAPAGDRWLVREPDLGQLQPSEVISIEDAPAAHGGDQ